MISTSVLYTNWSDPETYSGLLFDVVGAEPNSELLGFADWDLLVAAVGSEAPKPEPKPDPKPEPKPRPGLEPRFPKPEVDEVSGCSVAAEVVAPNKPGLPNPVGAEVVAEDPKWPDPVDPVAVSDMEVDEVRPLEGTNPLMDLKEPKVVQIQHLLSSWW